QDSSNELPNVPKMWTCNGTDINIRTYDGTCNNLKHSNWETQNRVYDRGDFFADYKNNYSGKPAININARIISNIL
ncbi:17105_t:CDS:1, partial [Cetraspora pellucida]